MTPKLTVDLGLRWEYYTPFVGIADQGGLSNYDPTNNTVQVAGYGSIPQNVGVKSNWGNFAPRLGAAYRFNEKTVLRAGFGTTIVPVPGQPVRLQLPGQADGAVQRPEQLRPGGLDGDRASARRRSSRSRTTASSTRASRSCKNAQLFYVQSDLKEAKLHSWNLALQRQLPWELVGEVAYVGNVGRGIVIADYNMNAGMMLGADNAGRPFYQLLRPHGERARLPAHEHVLQLAAGQARPPLQERLPADDLVHPRQGGQLRRRDRHRDAGRPRAEQGPRPASTASTCSRRASSTTCRSSRRATASRTGCSAAGSSRGSSPPTRARRSTSPPAAPRWRRPGTRSART